jgi:hypothetical protein
MRVDLLAHEAQHGVGDLAVFGGEFMAGFLGGRGVYMRATPKVLGRSVARLALGGHVQAQASTRRVSRGSMMPSSHSRAVPNSAWLSLSRRGAAVAHRRQRFWSLAALAGALQLGAVDDVHHLGGLRAAHHRGARRGPGEDEARVEAAPAHAVVAGAEEPPSTMVNLGTRALATAWIILLPCLMAPACSAALPTM